ncbi:MAG: hypothetical protein JNK04_11560 [Myxococcales bacterium]|nr:hypothetical protein [Myxococcales bacterium]
MKKSGNGGEQDCGIAWDGDQVLIGCLPSVTDWYLLVELESDGEFVAHQLSEGDGFTTDCTSFACTGAQADSGSLTGAQFEADGNAVVVSVPVSSVGTSFSVALEIGSTIIAEMPASFPATAGESAAAERYECTRPVSCE